MNFDGLRGMMNERIGIALSVMALGALGFQYGNARQTATPPAQANNQPTYFVEHPDHIQPGLAFTSRWAQLKNPYEGNAQRIAEGSKLFISYNCMDCHGADGSGAMGPSLQDSRWHFGGTAGDVFQSIYEGRPDGMPSWGGRIADDQIWRLVAYVQSLSKGHDVATENFTGKTVARSGH
jgi:cytochrome c oxidase cbb3-type subunit III